MKKILVADDDVKICQLVEKYLEDAGFAVVCVVDGQQAFDIALEQDISLVILDYMMPKLDGLQVLKKLRNEKATLPIIMLTARDTEAERIQGLDMGADDYIGKPFSPRELVARVNTILRRIDNSIKAKELIKRGDLLIDITNHKVLLSDNDIDLTAVEFKLLTLLAQQPGRVWSRLQIIEAVHGYAFEGFERVIDVHIKNIRRKLSDDFKQPRFIMTIYGIGYKYVED